MLEKVKPIITKKATKMPYPISIEEKLIITLRYLAIEGSLNSLKYQLRLHETTIGKFIVHVCEAIYNVFTPDCMKWKSTKHEFIIDTQPNEQQMVIS